MAEATFALGVWQSTGWVDLCQQPGVECGACGRAGLLGGLTGVVLSVERVRPNAAAECSLSR